MSHFQLNLKQCKTSSPSSSHSTTVYYYTLAPNIYQVFTLIMSEKRSRCHHITPREIFLSGYELFCQATHSFFQLGVELWGSWMFGFTQHTVHSLLLLPQILQDAMISLKLGGKSTAFLLHPIPLASWQMTRSTKMHWYLSFSKLVQLKQEFIRQRVLSVVENWYY